MAERGTDVQTVLAALQDIRLPADAPGGLLAEIAVALSLGLALALALATLLTFFARRRQWPVSSSGIDDRLDRIAALPEQERAVALLHLARQLYRDFELPDASALYAPDGFPTAAEIENRIRLREAQDA